MARADPGQGVENPEWQESVCMTEDEFLEESLLSDRDTITSEVKLAFIDYITTRLSAQQSKHETPHTQAFLSDLDAILDGDVTVEYNAQVVDEVSNYGYHVISNATKDYQELYDIAVLLMSAPKGPEGMQKHSYSQNLEARQKQLTNFFERYKSKYFRYKVESMTAIVNTYDEVLGHIRSFFKCIGNSAKLAVIVFNGHGTPQGNLGLEGEQTHISNTRFVDDVHTAWREHKSKHCQNLAMPIYLPVQVRLILAQCFGHKFQQNVQHKDILKVISLSSDVHPTTTSKIWWSDSEITSNTKVINSHHVDLDQYADHRDTRSSIHSILEKEISIEQPQTIITTDIRDSRDNELLTTFAEKVTELYESSNQGEVRYDGSDSQHIKDKILTKPRADSMSQIRNSTISVLDTITESPAEMETEISIKRRKSSGDVTVLSTKKDLAAIMALDAAEIELIEKTTTYKNLPALNFRTKSVYDAKQHENDYEKWKREYDARIGKRGRTSNYHSLPPSVAAQLAMIHGASSNDPSVLSRSETSTERLESTARDEPCSDQDSDGGKIWLLGCCVKQKRTKQSDRH